MRLWEFPLTLAFALATLSPLAAQANWRLQLAEVPQLGLPWLQYDTVLGRMLLYGDGGDFGAPMTHDTWTYTSGAWQRLAVPDGPNLAAMKAAFDSARNRIVVHGQVLAAATETWEFDGTDWTLVASGSPPATSSTMAYDPTRGVTVLYVEGQTWEWNGVVWSLRLSLNSPGQRHAARLVYHSGRQTVVLSGGRDNSFPVATTFGDLWEWNGINWTQINTSAPSRESHGLAYDPARNRLVMFGGRNQLGEFVATWEWDGATWINLTVAPHPPAGNHVQNLAYHPGRGTVMLYGGSHGDSGTWEWNGTAWTDLTPPVAAQPLPRAESAIAYDRQRSKAVMYGGNTFANQSLCDTWEYDSSGWSLANPPTQPPCVRDHVMVFDEQRAVSVMCPNAVNQTWEYDGADWVLRGWGPGVSSAAMAYDSVRGRSVVFGGYPINNDLRSWDGQNWTLLPTNGAPAARASHGMVYDRRRDRLVLFGGVDSAGNTLTDTWEFDGVAWQQAASGPFFQPGFTLVYDIARDRTVLAGGNFLFPGLFVPETWEWNGVAWAHRPLSISGASNGHSSTYDSDARRVLLVTPDSMQPYQSTMLWEYATLLPARVDGIGAGCVGSAGPPTLGAELHALPWIGDQMTLDVTGIPSIVGGAAFLGLGLQPVDFDLASIGAPTCHLLADTFVFLPLIPQNGFASWSLNFPVDPSLAGQEYYGQVFSIDPPANSLGLTLSNAVRIVPGIR